MRRFRNAWAAFVLLCLAALCAAQVHYAKGQNVAPTFEGWEQNPDGTFNMVFGYLNRNYEEELDIPVGPNNNVALGTGKAGDQGQPEHFYPRRQRFMFNVVVPANWDKTQKVVWTLTSYGKTDLAKGWLQPEWELSEGVKVENMGGGVPDPANKPPTLTVGAPQTISVGDKATITASATDDGLPKPYRQAANNPDRDSQPKRPRGVQIKWTQYRGPAKVTIDPPATPVVYGTTVESAPKVTFTAPGKYVLRATADDSQLFTSCDVTVTVR